MAIDSFHHATQRGNNHSPAFFDDPNRQFYCDALNRYSRRRNLEIWAHCLTANHVHLVVLPRDREMYRDFLWDQLSAEEEGLIHRRTSTAARLRHKPA